MNLPLIQNFMCYTSSGKCVYTIRRCFVILIQLLDKRTIASKEASLILFV